MSLSQEEINGFIGEHVDEVLLTLNSRLFTKMVTPFPVVPGSDIDLDEDPVRVYILYNPDSFEVTDIVEP